MTFEAGGAGAEAGLPPGGGGGTATALATGTESSSALNGFPPEAKGFDPALADLLVAGLAAAGGADGADVGGGGGEALKLKG